MPLIEKDAFILDEKEDMTFEEKNRQLAAEVGVSPHSKRKIVRIERMEIGGTGWKLIYRVGTPD